jgi:hypothetical protein
VLAGKLIIAEGLMPVSQFHPTVGKEIIMQLRFD